MLLLLIFTWLADGAADVPGSPAYFTAFKHVLSALLEPDTLRANPLSDVVVTETASSSHIPSYLSGCDISLRPLLVQARSGGVRVHWRPGSRIGLEATLQGAGLQASLDPSQLAAVEHCLTHRVAVVIGPPGTGKSYTGVGCNQA